MNKTADVIIIGGGIVGCATAYYLAKSGTKNVIVLESTKSIGHGGSCRNGGGVRQSGRDVRELPYAMYGIEHLWPTLSEELGVDVEYTQKGNLRLGKTEEHLKKLKTLADNAKKAGLGVEMVDAKEVQEICPYLSDEIIGASWCPTDGHANPLTTTLGYYKRSLELGVSYYTDANVASLKKVRGKVRQVILNDGTIFEGEQIILAAGYESRAIARTVGVDLPMTRLIDEMFVTEMQPHMFDIMLGTSAADFYGHQAHHGSFVFGSECGYEEGAAWLAEAKAYVQENARVFSRLLSAAGVPLKPLRLESTFLLWVDCRGCCKNDAEVVDLFENRCHLYGSTGSHYQTDFPFIRLNIAVPRSVIEEAAERLIRALSVR